MLWSCAVGPFEHGRDQLGQVLPVPRACGCGSPAQPHVHHWLLVCPSCAWYELVEDEAPGRLSAHTAGARTRVACAFIGIRVAPRFEALRLD